MSAPTTDQLRDIVTAAADALTGGGSVDDMARFQAAGCAVKVAADTGDDELLNLVILAATGKYEQASALLMRIALSQGGSQSAPAFDPLANIVNLGTTSTVPAPAAQPAAPAAPAPAPKGRRAPRSARPAGN